MAVDLFLHIDRGEDNRLNGTVRAADANEVRSFSGTLELLRVFEDMLDGRPGATSWHRTPQPPAS